MVQLQQASAANRKDKMKKDEQTSSVIKATAKKLLPFLMTKAEVKHVQEFKRSWTSRYQGNPSDRPSLPQLLSIRQSPLGLLL